MTTQSIADQVDIEIAACQHVSRAHRFERQRRPRGEILEQWQAAAKLASSIEQPVRPDEHADWLAALDARIAEFS